MLNYRGLTREFPQIGCPRSIVALQPHAGVNATSTIWFLADCPSVRRQWPIQWHDEHLAVAMASLTHRKDDKFLAERAAASRTRSLNSSRWSGSPISMKPSASRTTR